MASNEMDLFPIYPVLKGGMRGRRGSGDKKKLSEGCVYTYIHICNNFERISLSINQINRIKSI